MYVADAVVHDVQRRRRSGQRRQRQRRAASGFRRARVLREVDVDRVGDAARLEGAQEVHEVVNDHQLRRAVDCMNAVAYRRQSLQRVRDVHRHRQDAQRQIFSSPLRNAHSCCR